MPILDCSGFQHEWEDTIPVEQFEVLAGLGGVGDTEYYPIPGGEGEVGAEKNLLACEGL